MAYYALYQAGHAVYGVGKSLGLCLRDATQWLENGMEDAERAEFLRGNGPEVDGELYIRECSRELFETIIDAGGAIRFTVDQDGTLIIPKEA